VIIVHGVAKPAAASDGVETATVQRKLVEPSELQIPPGAIWIDLIEPTVEEDRKVQEFVGVPVPIKANPDYTEPPEAHYLENGVRYLHALFISEPEDTPDVTGVTFVIAQTALVTVRYHPVETFDFFSQKLCKAPAQMIDKAFHVGICWRLPRQRAALRQADLAVNSASYQAPRRKRRPPSASISSIRRSTISSRPRSRSRNWLRASAAR